MPKLTPSILFNWQRVLSVTGAATAAPPKPGIYAYAETPRTFGLPNKPAWVYIGQSKNLKSRLSQHSARHDPHAKLRDWLHRSSEREVWYAVVPIEHLDEVERTLINELEPRLNRLKYEHFSTPVDNPGEIKDNPDK